MRQQLHFETIPAPESRANRGREFELMLEQTHDFYVRANTGYVEKISNKWVYCSEQDWRGLPEAIKARDGEGRPMRRAKTMCDYLGHAFGYGVAFDAKQFKDASIPIEKNFKPHQVHGLFNFLRTGGCAGFIIWSRRNDKVYWINAALMMSIVGAGVLKSLNIAWLDENATLITEHASRDIVDWARVLLKDKTK